MITVVGCREALRCHGAPTLVTTKQVVPLYRLPSDCATRSSLMLQYRLCDVLAGTALIQSLVNGPIEFAASRMSG